MKKNYNFIAVILISVLCFFVGTVSAQVYLSEDFSGITASGNQQCEATQSALTTDDFNASYLGTAGWTTFKFFPANGKVKLGTSSAQGWLQTPPTDCSANNGEFRVRFDAKAWNKSGESSKLYICLNLPENTAAIFNNSTEWRNYIVDSVENLPVYSNTEECTMASFTVYLTGGSTDTKVAFVAEKATNSRFYLDNIYIESANIPDINISGNSEIRTLVNTPATTTLTVTGHNLNASGTTSVSIEGPGFSVSPATLNNSDLMNGVGADITVTFQGTTGGEFNGSLILSNEDTMKTMMITATCFSYTEVATIAELREKIDWSDVNANAPDSVIYRYTGEAIVTAADSYNNQKMIQDATGAIFIYDRYANITTSLAIGDKVSGIIGTLTNYYGYLEFCPVADVENKISSYNDVDALSITVAQLNDFNFMSQHQSELVALQGSTFVSAGTFVTGNYAERLVISQDGAVDTAIYTYFRNNVDYIGSTIPSGCLDIVGVNYFTSVKVDNSCQGNTCARYPTRYYVIPRSSYDFIPCTGVAENEMNTVKVYPNPTNNTVTVELNENATHIYIYDVFGKLVDSHSANMGVNTISLDNVTTGVYFLRIFNNNELIGTTKVVKK